MKKALLVLIVLLCAVNAGYAQSNIYVGKVVGKGKTSGKMVALTFDDGPSKTYTPQVLAVLKKYNIKATFFMCGEQVTYYPELVKQVSSEGHEIANHSFSHPNLYKYKDKSKRGAVLAAEVVKTNALLEKLVMIKPAYFRAPYNYRDTETVKAINDLGLIYVGWTFSVRDWEKPAPEAMVNMFNQNLIPGTILLMHDGGGNRTNTIAALPGIIESAQKKGYRFVTLGEILK
ncbi:MAG: polysaccharide deacetylase family protein [Elusimicrobia bacterium]|nr:polysaccharide deacetylase family protein [Elusimicrobiota bacterium]